MSQDYTSLFIESVNEYLHEFEDIILNLIKSTNYNKADIDSLFRVVHTIKGTSGMFSADVLANFAHKLEFFLDKVRYNKIELNTRLLNILLLAKDIMHKFIEDYANGANSDTSKANQIIFELEKIESDTEQNSNKDHNKENIKSEERIKANILQLKEIIKENKSVEFIINKIIEIIELSKNQSFDSLSEFLAFILDDLSKVRVNNLKFSKYAQKLLLEGVEIANEILIDSLCIKSGNIEETEIDPEAIMRKLQKPLEFKQNWSSLAYEQKFLATKNEHVYKIVFSFKINKNIDNFSNYKQIAKHIFENLSKFGKTYILKN